MEAGEYSLVLRSFPCWGAGKIRDARAGARLRAVRIERVVQAHVHCAREGAGTPVAFGECRRTTPKEFERKAGLAQGRQNAGQAKGLNLRLPNIRN